MSLVTNEVAQFEDAPQVRCSTLGGNSLSQFRDRQKQIGKVGGAGVVEERADMERGWNPDGELGMARRMAYMGGGCGQYNLTPASQVTRSPEHVTRSCFPGHLPLPSCVSLQ